MGIPYGEKVPISEMSTARKSTHLSQEAHVKTGEVYRMKHMMWACSPYVTEKNKEAGSEMFQTDSKRHSIFN